MRDSGTSALSSSITVIIVLLLAIGLGFLIPSLTPKLPGVERLGAELGAFGVAFWGLIIGALLLALVILLRQNTLAVVLVGAVALCLDWYLGLYILAPILALVLLAVFFLSRSPQYPWTEPRALWLWGLLLLLSISPAIRGATNAYDAAYYYPNIILGALLMYWLGNIIARDSASVRRFFQFLAFFATLMALHTIIAALTGIFLFSTTRINNYLATVNDFALFGSATNRIGSLLGNPDWNGAFLAMMVFIPVGLLASTPSWLAKLFYLAEAILILLALLFTYTAASWIAVVVGMLPLILLVSRGSWRFWMPVFACAIIAAIYLVFPHDSILLLQHLTAQNGWRLRLGAWETALNVIQAFPLTGIGMGLSNYLLRAEPYRAPLQYVPLAHPHNSYLELGAFAGLPVLIVFVALLLLPLGPALRNWKLADSKRRSLLGGGIAAVITLSINSLAINGWTLPPLAITGWLILGVISSPLLAKSRDMDQQPNEKMMEYSS